MQKGRTRLPDGRYLLPEALETTYRLMSPVSPKFLDALFLEFSKETGKKIAEGKLIGFETYKV